MKQEESKAVYDAQFKKIAQMPVICCSVLHRLHPDFGRFTVMELVRFAHRDSDRSLLLRNTELEEGGHTVRLDRLGSCVLPLPDAYDNLRSHYLMSLEMQLKQQLPYHLEVRSSIYTAAMNQVGIHADLYAWTWQPLSVWLLPRRIGHKVHPPKVLPCSVSAHRLGEFLQDPDGWYTEDTEKLFSSIRNTASQAIWFVEFGRPEQNTTELQDILYHLFLEKERDYAWLEAHGIRLDDRHRKELDQMYEAVDVIYDNAFFFGKSEGMAEGMAEGRSEERRNLSARMAACRSLEDFRNLQRSLTEEEKNSNLE